MRQRKGAVIIWPAYLDSNLTRAQGRRIPSNLAAPAVTVGILKEAADMRGFESEIEQDKRFPRSGRDRKGYLVLENPEGHKKNRLLLMLAKGVRKVVAQRLSAKKAAETKSKKKGKRKGRK